MRLCRWEAQHGDSLGGAGEEGASRSCERRENLKGLVWGWVGEKDIRFCPVEMKVGSSQELMVGVFGLESVGVWAHQGDIVGQGKMRMTG